MTDSIQTLRLFVRVARTGSFSRTAREASLSQPSVSRIVAELEKSVGAQLLTRTTRALSLTEAGADYLARIEPILAALEEADHAARGTGELRGVLRVATGPSFAMRAVIPRLPAFLERHPKLRLDLTMEDRRQDLLSEGVDLALRFGSPGDSLTATTRKIATARRVLVAAPSYLARAGTPTSPADLAGHAVIVGPASVVSGGWTFEKDGRTLSVRVEGRFTTNANEGAVAAATAGLGIVSTGDWGSHTEREDGRLVELLTDWKMGELDIHAVFTAGRAAKPSARAFAAYLAESFQSLAKAR
jgi:DNA-binding transcriptional LysR family regulator